MQKNIERNQTQGILDSIRRIVKALRESSRVSEKQLGISSAQLFVLQKLHESGESLSINELAERTLTHQSSVSVVVTKLEMRKLVERLPSKSDGRVVKLRLTSRGKGLLSTRSPLIQERLVEALNQLSPQEREGLMTGLQALILMAGLHDEEPSLFFEESQ